MGGGGGVFMRVWLFISENMVIAGLSGCGIETLHCFLRRLGLIVTKPVFGISDKATLKPVSLATETS